MSEIVNIVNSVDANSLNNLKTVSERYYEHKYCNRIPAINNAVHQKIGFHSNRMCLVSLAEYHPVMQQKKKIKCINWQASEQVNRLDNAASGKGKKGAQKLKPNSILCHVECEDGSSHPVYSCLQGKLVEINETLLKDPNLLVEKPMSLGYIALLLPYLALYDDFKKSLISKDVYFANSE